MRGAVLFLAIAVLLGGCQSAGPRDPFRDSRPDVDALLDGAALFGAPADVSSLPDEDPLALGSDAERFLAEHAGANPIETMRSVAAALRSDGPWRIEYDPEATLSAAATLAERRGNCISLTNLFVALARREGLKAHFRQVDIPPTWSQSGSVVRFNQHIAAGISRGRAPDLIVDFNPATDIGEHASKRLSDDEARSQYFSNVGVHHLTARDEGRAFAYLKKAIELAPGDAGPWINLGVLYVRSDLIDHAEAAFMEAYRRDPMHLVASSSLARLYGELGFEDLAGFYRERGRRLRLRNPHYHFWLAKRAFAAAAFEETVRHLDAAIDRDDRIHGFFALRSDAYRAVGDTDRARRDLERALRLSRQPAQRADYVRRLADL